MLDTFYSLAIQFPTAYPYMNKYTLQLHVKVILLGYILGCYSYITLPCNMQNINLRNRILRSVKRIIIHIHEIREAESL